MRCYPEDDDDRKELEGLNAEPWMVELLKLNPSYPHWGPGEDAMHDDGENDCGSWEEFAVTLNDWNECVNFHFELMRATEKCSACDGSGYNPETRLISEAFYGGGVRSGWREKITPDEAEALRAQRRIGGGWDAERKAWVPDGRSVEQLAADCNEKERTGFCHDGINQHILVETRAKRLGVYGLCPRCEGHGHVFTEPAAHLGLVLWLLHPRHSASVGVQVNRIEQHELPAVFAWLTEAARRNAERFEKVVALAAKGGKEP